MADGDYLRAAAVMLEGIGADEFNEAMSLYPSGEWNVRSVKVFEDKTWCVVLSNRSKGNE